MVRIKQFVMATIVAAVIGLGLGSVVASAAQPIVTGTFGPPAPAKAERTFGSTDQDVSTWGTFDPNPTAPRGARYRTTIDVTLTNPESPDGVARDVKITASTPGQYRRWLRYVDQWGTQRPRSLPGRIINRGRAHGRVAVGATEHYASWFGNAGSPYIAVQARDVGGSGGWSVGGWGTWDVLRLGRFPSGSGGGVTDTVDVSGTPPGAMVDIDHNFAGVSFGTALVNFADGTRQTATLDANGMFRLTKPGMAFTMELVVSASSVVTTPVGSVFTFRTDSTSDVDNTTTTGVDESKVVDPADPMTVFAGVAVGSIFKVTAE